MAASAGPASRDDWDQHWDDYADAAQKNPAQAFRRRLVFGMLGLEPKSKLLDVGSGQGDFAAETLSGNPTVELLGLEVSAGGIEISKRKAPSARFLERDLTEAQTPPEQWREWADRAVCSEVLEHVDDPHAVLVNAQTYMEPGCRLVVTVPGGPMSAFDRHIGHRRHFSPADLRNLLEGAGFEVEMSAGKGLPFFNLYRLAVIARGDRLVDDVSSGRESESRFASAAMSFFELLFKLNLPVRRGGWQTVALARRPG